MDDYQEREVARGLREGKADAWRALYDAYAERVWGVVARLMGPASADVADVVQETFLAAARSADGYNAERGNLWYWLWGIARRHVALHYRKQDQQARLRAAAADWLAAGKDPSLRRSEAANGSPPDALVAAELASLVRATLTELPVDYEMLLTAKYLDGVPVEHIASREHSTASAVRSKLARARSAFREAFEKNFPLVADGPARDNHGSTGR